MKQIYRIFNERILKLLYFLSYLFLGHSLKTVSYYEKLDITFTEYILLYLCANEFVNSNTTS